MKEGYLAQMAAEAAALKALKDSDIALIDAILGCKVAGFAESEILRKVLEQLSPSVWKRNFTISPLFGGTVMAQHQPFMTRSNQAWQ
jgi:hypothetical protein